MNSEYIKSLIGENKYKIFIDIKKYIDENYDMEVLYNECTIKTKKWKYEIEYRKSGKTMCGFYFCEDILDLMIIFGGEERNKLENIRTSLSEETLKYYDEAKTYHDGKWVMFEIDNISILEDIKKILLIKRKPNKKDE